MPTQPCTKNGKPGKKWGKTGTCYTGPGAVAKVQAQAAAIKARQKERK